MNRTRLPAALIALLLAAPAAASRNSGGTYSLATGNPVTSGQTITSAWANGTLSDLGQGITDSLDRSGRGGMLAALRGVDGSLSAPALSFTSETGTGFWRAGTNDFRLSIGGVQRTQYTSTGEVLTGTLSVSGATTVGSLSTSGTAATGALTVTGTATATAFSGPLTGAVTGNATTATALAANGTNCATGYVAAGVDASGNAEGCLLAGALATNDVVSGAIECTGISTSGSWVDATCAANPTLTVTITTSSGRSILLTLEGSAATTAGLVKATTTGAAVRLVRGAGPTQISQYSVASGTQVPGLLAVIDNPGTGTFTYKIQVQTGAGGTIDVRGLQLHAHEL